MIPQIIDMTDYQSVNFIMDYHHEMGNFGLIWVFIFYRDSRAVLGVIISQFCV